MRLIINLVLVALIAVLIWVLYSSISEPIAFQSEYEKRMDAVTGRLMQIRSAQELYRDVTGKFANSFDSLEYTIKNGKVQVVSVYGDPDDPSNTDAIRYDTTYESALEKAKMAEINLDSLRYVPFGSGSEFNIQADTVTYQQTLVNVVEVGIPTKNFMGPYADARFSRYDSNYDPNFVVKFGNMNTPNTSGNWER